MRQLARERGVQLLLPQDVVVAYSLNDDAGCCTVPLTLGCCSAEAPCVPHGEAALPRAEQLLTAARALSLRALAVSQAGRCNA
jgi:hypothetical protein